MDKNLISIVIILAVVMIGAFFAITGDSVFDVAAWQEDEENLQKVSSELGVISEDNALLEELDATTNDILDATAPIEEGAALDTTSIVAEGSGIDFSDAFNGFAEDESSLAELDQIFSEVSQ